jgi:RNA polymerase sigma-70 factor (ECF subfamily)
MGNSDDSVNIHHMVADFSEQLYRYAYRLSGSVADAEDLTQETFCKAQEQLHQLRDHSRAKAWLFSILRNAYLHRLRSDKNHRHVSIDTVGDIPQTPREGLTGDETEKIQQALTELDEVFRTPVILYYFEDFSYRDIAEQMDLPIGTVMSRLARAKAYLRQRLAPSIQPLLTDGPRRASDGL